MILFEDVSLVIKSGRSQTTVLEPTTLTLPSDERLAVLAQPGCGKTSLIRLLAGSLLPSSGTIARHAHVSFPVGFTGGYKAKLTVQENIAHAARLYGADVDEVVGFVSLVADLGVLLHELYGDVPSQIRTRLAYATSYAIPFDTYLIDNRVGVGDDEFRRKCERMLEERGEEAGFILATGLPRYARRFATRGAVLHRGMLTLYDDLESACAAFEELEAAGDAARGGPAGGDPAERPPGEAGQE